MKKEKGQQGQPRRLNHVTQDSTRGNSTKAQRNRILVRLRNGPASTIDLRHGHDIMHPGMRICELRKEGFNIITHWSHEPTPGGKLHRVARYVLLNPKARAVA